MEIILEPDTAETRYALQTAARHELILKILADIAADMMICELEGWPKTEFIDMLFEEIAHFKRRQK